MSSRKVTGGTWTETGSSGTNDVRTAIRFLRNRSGMSARQLSIAAGLSPSYVSKVETGEIHLSFKAFAKIALVLDMSPLEMMFCMLTEVRDGYERTAEDQAEFSQTLDAVLTPGEVLDARRTS